MNERILEIARQVWPDPNISHTNHMKFAELIVRECIQAVSDDGIKSDWYQHLIKEHFGVQ